MKFFNKTSLKFIVGFLVVILLAFIILWIMSSKSFLRWVGERRISKFEQDVVEVYKADTDGGSTPYETFDLMLTALENGELGQASRYFVLNKQEKQKRRFEKMKSDGTLDEAVQRWKNAKGTFEEVRDNYNDWKERATLEYSFVLSESKTKKAPNGRGGFIEFTIPSGTHKSEISFNFNKYSEVWKIENL